MTEITMDGLYDLFCDTVCRCTSDVLALSEEDVFYNIFEQFDVGAISFLHVDSLNRLRNAGWIDDGIVEMSKEIRRRWFCLLERYQSSDERQNLTLERVKGDDEWRELFRLCDSLKP